MQYLVWCNATGIRSDKFVVIKPFFCTICYALEDFMFSQNQHYGTMLSSLWVHSNWFNQNHDTVSMTQLKTASTPLLTHWSYCSLEVHHQYSYVLIQKRWYSYEYEIYFILNHGNQLLEKKIVVNILNIEYQYYWIFGIFLWNLIICEQELSCF